MFKCSQCINYDICIEVCQPLEDALKDEGIYSSSYIHKHNETTVNPNTMDIISSKRAMKLRYGKKIIGNKEE